MARPSTPKLTDWIATSLGQFIIHKQRAKCTELVPSGYYPSCLQVGLATIDFFADMEIGESFVIANEIYSRQTEQKNTVKRDEINRRHVTIAASENIPFAHKTHNLIALPHTLDFCADGHSVLREVQHILIPGGLLIISGFNPLSLWGLVRFARNSTNRAPWHGQYRRSKRVQDYLSLLGFELVGATFLIYQPPVQAEIWRSRLEFLEKAGARWWPFFGAVYIIVARKLEMIPTARRPANSWANFIPGIAQPAAQNSAKLDNK